jgi:hypothetical protein
VYVDWGPEFAAHHGMSFPRFTDPGMFVGLGPLGLDYILKVGGSGYFRQGAVQGFLASGALHLVPHSPEFQYPVYAVYSEENQEAELVSGAMAALREASEARPITSKGRVRRRPEEMPRPPSPASSSYKIRGV